MNKTSQLNDDRLPQFHGDCGSRILLYMLCNRETRSASRSFTNKSTADSYPSDFVSSTSEESANSSDSTGFAPPPSHEAPTSSGELIELLYKKVMSSESVCPCVCGCPQRRNRVSPEVRVQAFLKRRLWWFVPKTDRCCDARATESIGRRVDSATASTHRRVNSATTSEASRTHRVTGTLIQGAARYFDPFERL